MICTTCRQDRTFLIRNFCVRCAPDLHQKYDESKQAFDRVYARYVNDTGREPLQDWEAFVV